MTPEDVPAEVWDAYTDPADTARERLAAALTVHERQVREQVAAGYRAAAQAIEDSDGLNDDPLTDAIWAGAKTQRGLKVVDAPPALAAVAYRHLADRIDRQEPRREAR